MESTSFKALDNVDREILLAKMKRNQHAKMLKVVSQKELFEDSFLRPINRKQYS